MHRWMLIAFMVVFFLDPELTLLGSSSVEKEMVVTFMLSLIAMPWVVAQLDN